MIHPFSGTPVPTLGQVGGKARSLIEATAAGFKVPTGFVLDVNFFQPWLDEVRAGSAWHAFLDSGDDDTRAACDGVKAACTSLALTDEQQAALGEALGTLNAQHCFAVRSSSPEEDLAGTSFAGGYETTLGVTPDTLQEALRTSFTSVFDERIVAYKRQHGMATDHPRIAVIVQEQVPSDVSGVAFSLNPQNNCYDEAVINANFGLGETVVNGHVTPDTYVVEKVRREILERGIASKSHAAWLVNGGGTEERDNADPEAPSLTDEQALAVAQLAADAEAHYGAPMDIEWAIHDGTLYLLQSRPITAYVPLPAGMITEPGAQKNLYLDAVVLDQGFSDSLSVLGSVVFARMAEKLKGDAGIIDRGMDGTLINMDGRHYMHLSNLARALGAFVGSLLKTYDTPTRRLMESIDLKGDYLPDKVPEPLKGAALKAVLFALKGLPVVLKGLTAPDKTVRSYQALFEGDLAVCRARAHTDVPFDEMADEFADRFGVQTTLIVGILVPAMLARSRLAKLFKDDAEATDLLAAVDMDLPGNPTAEMGRRMFELASFDELQEAEDGHSFAANILARAYSDDFMGAYDAYMARFGCRCIKEIDVGTPRSYENLPAFFDQLRAMDIHNDTVRGVEQRRRTAVDRLLAIARARGKDKQVAKHVHTIRSLAGYREAPKYFFVYTVDLLRRRALVLGQRFVGEGRLDRAQQVFDLTPAQVARAERDPDTDLRAQIARNLAPREKLDRVRNWPRMIDSRGKIPQAPLAETEDGLVGDPIAPGTVRGPAKILHAPYEKPLEKGEILVTHASDPGWTPIFINAAGVVLEVGGALQHGAVIAREYGLPCVSGLDGVTDILTDGQMIEVDGSNGVVRILEEPAEDAA